jgi:hypothetical protein
MKTAMQLMLEDLELRYKVLSKAEMLQACGAIEGTIDYAKSLIIKEKEQIIKAVEDTRSNIVPRMFINENLSGEDYYHETYNPTISKITITEINTQKQRIIDMMKDDEDLGLYSPI